MQLNFRCEFHGYDLCFFGGVCQTHRLSGQESCVCPEGFGHDFIPLHSPNCSLPDKALPYFSIVFVLVWVLVFVYFGSKQRMAHTPQLQTLATYTMLYHLTLGAVMLGYYMEGGLFAFTFLGCVFLYPLNAMVLSKTLSLTLELMHLRYSESLAQFRVNLHRAEYFFWILNLSLGLPIAWMLRKNYQLDPSFADLLVSLFAFCSLGSLAVIGWFFWNTSNALVRMMEKSSKILPLHSNSSHAVAVARVRTVQRILGFHSNIMGFALVFFSTVRFTLGSVPFFWVWVLYVAMCANLIPLGVSVFFNKNSKKKDDLPKRLPNSLVSSTHLVTSNNNLSASGGKSDESGVLLIPSSSVLYF